MKSVTQFSEQSRVVSRLFPREATGCGKARLFSLFLWSRMQSRVWVFGLHGLDTWLEVWHLLSLYKRSQSDFTNPLGRALCLLTKSLRISSETLCTIIIGSLGALDEADSTKTFIFLFIVSFICVAAQTEMASEKLPMHTWTIILPEIEIRASKTQPLNRLSRCNRLIQKRLRGVDVTLHHQPRQVDPKRDQRSVHIPTKPAFCWIKQQKIESSFSHFHSAPLTSTSRGLKWKFFQHCLRLLSFTYTWILISMHVNVRFQRQFNLLRFFWLWGLLCVIKIRQSLIDWK